MKRFGKRGGVINIYPCKYTMFNCVLVQTSLHVQTNVCMQFPTCPLKNLTLKTYSATGAWAHGVPDCLLTPIWFLNLV